MPHRWLFYLDADGWVVGPESAPSPGEARILNAALIALRKAATGSESLGLADRTGDRPRAHLEPRPA
jgi:hypothetical protein